jgi:hypothetical protein
MKLSSGASVGVPSNSLQLVGSGDITSLQTVPGAEALTFISSKKKLKSKLHGLSPRANYIDRAAAACRRSECQLLRIEGATWSE